MDMSAIRFNEQGLVPAIAQDARTGRVLMMAWMNEESLNNTLKTGRVQYYSRTRQVLWTKGETSGNTQMLKSAYYDCDGDTLLLKVEQTGPACHTGEENCFFNRLPFAGEDDAHGQAGPEVLAEVFSVIKERKANPKEGSYTCYLFDKGLDKILKKVGEESAEVIIAAKNRAPEEVRYETADLFYHVMVLLVEQGIELEDIYEELKGRR